MEMWPTDPKELKFQKTRPRRNIQSQDPTHVQQKQQTTTTYYQFTVQGVYKSSLTNFQISRTHLTKFQSIFMLIIDLFTAYNK